MPLREDALAHSYSTIAVPLDKLPYTSEFERLLSHLRQSAAPADDMSERQVWRDLLDLRKRGKLPRVGRGHHAT